MAERLTAIQESALEHLVLKHFGESEFTDEAWAELHNIPRMTVQRWKNDPHPRYAYFQAVLKERIRDYDTDKDLTARLMRVKALEAMFDGLQKSKGAERRQYINMVLANTKEVERDQAEVDYSHLSDEELEEAMLARNLNMVEVATEEVRGLVCGSSSSASSPVLASEPDCSTPDGDMDGTAEEPSSLPNPSPNLDAPTAAKS